MTENRGSKIEIKSKRFGETVIEEIFATTSEVIERTSELKEEEKAQWIKRFRDIFETAFQDCVSVDGQSWAEVDESSNTTEFEPMDLEKKEYINGELTNQLHNAVIEVASKRKQCPPKYKIFLSKYLSAELCRLGSQKVVCNSQKEPVSVSDDLLGSEDFVKRLQSTEATLSSTIQKSNELEKATKLELC